jgi:uncharacterized iron-regulated membrane protein
MDGSGTFSRSYRAVWRWHFYAGLFCLPFVAWLATTGSIYLFRPQIEAWLDRKYEHVAAADATAAPPSAQVAAALAAVPGGVLNAYQLPAAPGSAVQILVGKGKQLVRVYVNPVTREVIHQVPDDARPMRRIFHLHGELLLGDRGSMIVELAASWAIVMLLTGLFLWWPRNARGLAGVAYPRIGRGGRVVWRDLHAVTGFWVSGYALFLLFSGLPWAKSWGGLLKDVRGTGKNAPVVQAWATGTSSELAQRMAMNTQGAADEHAMHQGMAMTGGPPPDYAPLDRIVPVVTPLHLAPPVLVSPPSLAAARWTAHSDAANRTLQSSLVLDDTGRILRRTDFGQKPFLDRAIAYGISIHEGQLFGWPNRLLGVLTACGLLLMVASAIRLWWRGRPDGTLGAPPPLDRPRMSLAVIALIAVLGVVLPLFGLSLILVLAAERFALRRIPAAVRFLGLRAA